MVGLPLILFQADAEMGDLEYIETKVLAGDYFQVTGAINAITDTIEYVPATGKTAFLIEAKIVITAHTTLSLSVNSNVKDMVQATLKIDSVTKDTTNIGIQADGSALTSASGTPAGAGVGTIGDGRFNVLGLSLVGNSSKKIEIENTLDDGSAIATMSGYLV